jgi:hypothetical protein
MRTEGWTLLRAAIPNVDTTAADKAVADTAAATHYRGW